MSYAGWSEERKAKRRASNRRAALKHYYGMTVAEYDEMVKRQNGRCAICKTDKPGGFHGRWEVDHCHDTDTVRHLLCHRCNMGIAYFKHDVRLLQAAIDYLKEFAA